ncbi:MAG TPA: S-layer homology domain-containing protein [Candidatus Scatomorpha intestinavium]|uniref:S-layer homology domain-containing protein n=1 Tax=Candidatus Scatomorpha intestinavium TaxID=2840922 RepID=A0A9D1CSL6_9FIRM|nr:S-layer homology domain-containing protein [Candidatus Scatomorpha intestinavium]
MKKKPMSRVLALLLAAVFAVGALPASASYSASFSDVSADAWYADYVSLCATYGIINGYEDGTFRPEADITRAEFMKLLATIGELVPYKAIDTSMHWAAPYWDLMNDNGVLWGLDIPCTAAALDTAITRYEMCVMLSNFCSNVFSENFVELQNLQTAIADYSSIESKYVSSVEQAYGKGILTGYEDGTFRGNDTMTRSQAAAVVVRTAWPDERIEVSDANEVTGSTPSTDPDTGSAMDPADSFAWESRNYIDDWGNVSAEGRLILFGDASKSYFTGSEANLADYIVTVQVQTWDINSAGEYYTRTWNLEVNKAVAQEVVAIFEEIYASSERFPIHALGGARYTDSLRHSWGCAIDINPVENYYVNTTTWTALTGSYCYKTSDSPYCIRPDGIVVETFAKYGWGWGGGTAENDYTGWNTTADYMHFSILESGG